MNVKVLKLRAAARLPRYGSAEAAGADLHACLDAPVAISPGGSAFIGTGLAMEIPPGHAGFVYARSGAACRQGLAPANKVGVVDADYRGEWWVPLHNHGEQPQTVAPGERIAQLVLVPCMTAAFTEVDALDETERGSGGFGSTGT